MGRSIALLSGSGGSGKTTTALAIAEVWAQRPGGCTLVDTDDTKEAGTSLWWLDRLTNPPAELVWTKSTIKKLTGVLDRIATPVVVDTAPGLKSAETHELADSVSAAVVTGSVFELGEILQSALTIRASTDTPVAVAFTRTHTSTDSSSWGLAAREALAGADLPILGSVRQSTAIARAKIERRLPSQTRAPKQALTDLVANLDKWLEESEKQ